MAAPSKPRQARDAEKQPAKPNPRLSEHGPEAPKIPGAQEMPIIGRTEKKPPKKQKRLPRSKELARTEEEKTDAYLKKVTSPGSNVRARMNRLKELIEPISPSLIQVMSDIAHDKKVHAAIRLDAADRLLDRLYGKPKEHVQLDSPDDEAGNGDEVLKLLNNILESVGAPKLDNLADEERPSES